MRPPILPPHCYLLGLGGNRRHHRHGAPEAVLAAALAALAAAGVRVERAAPAMRSRPLGPGGRRFANTVAIIATAHDPAALLAVLKGVEHGFGRRGGRRWGPRVLDLDIIAWSGGAWRSGSPARGDGLVVPHPAAAYRRFVLAPALAIAATWRLSGSSPRTIRQAHARLTRPRPTPRRAAVHRAHSSVGRATDF